jgi:hypothetical protein
MPEVSEIYWANAIKLQQLSVMIIREYLKTCHCCSLPISKWQTNYIVEGQPYKVNNYSTNHELPCFYKNPEVDNHVHKSQPLDTMFNQSNNHPYLHIILHQDKFYYYLPPVRFTSPRWFLSFRFSDPHAVCISPLPQARYTCCLLHSSQSDYPNMWCRVQNYEAPHYLFFLSSLLVHLFDSEITFLLVCSQMSNYFFPKERKTKIQVCLVFSHVSIDGYLGLNTIHIGT